MPEQKPTEAEVRLARAMYEDTDYTPPAGLNMQETMKHYAETRYPGTSARMETATAIRDIKAENAREREAIRVEREQERSARARQTAIDQIKRDPQLRIRDDEVTAIEKLMHERGIGTYEDAAYRYRQINQVAEPATSSYAGAVEILGLDGAGGDDGKWLSSAFRKSGVDLGLLDKLTKRRVATILDDFKRDRTGAEARWA